MSQRVMRWFGSATIAGFLTMWAVDAGGQLRELTPATLAMRVSPPVGRESCRTMAYADTLVREFPCSGWSIDSLVVAGTPALRLRIGTSYETIVGLATLRPLSTRYLTPRDSFDVSVTGPLATGWIAWGGKPLREVRDTIGESAFFGVLVEHLLGTFPLDHGYEVVVPIYAPYGGVSRDTLRVLAMDTVQVRGSAHPAWRVALIAPRANAGVRTFWVDLRTGRLLKRENSGPGGARVVQTVQ